MGILGFLRNQWDRVLGWTCVALGALAILLGWLGASRYGFPAAQLPYVISGGLGGLALIGVGSVLILSADTQDEWRQLNVIDEKLDRLLGAPDSQGASEIGNGEISGPSELVVEPVERTRKARLGPSSTKT